MHDRHEELHTDVREIREDVKELLQRVSKIEGKAAMISTFISLGVSLIMGFVGFKMK